MKRKWLVVLSTVLVVMFLAGCGNAGEENSRINKEEFDSDHIVETDLGTLYLTYKEKDLDFNAESGPIDFTVSGIQIGDLEEAEEHKGLFGKEVAIITLTMESLNTSDNTISFYPNKANLTTDAGDDVEADTFFSDTIGGEYEGKVETKGDVIFIVDSAAKDIGQLQLQIFEPKDENDKSLGNPIDLKINLK